MKRKKVDGLKVEMEVEVEDLEVGSESRLNVEMKVHSVNQSCSEMMEVESRVICFPYACSPSNCHY